jgi:hypothetical protein
MKKFISVILVLTLVLALAVPCALAAGTGYADVSGHWAEAAITKWSNQGVITGYEGKFRPNDPITRGEFVIILDRILDYQKAAKNNFSDLSETYYTDALLKASFAGVISGYTDGTVKPTQNISRQEAFVMIARAFKLTAPAGYSIKATDAKDISDFATKAVAALESKGLIQGRDGGKLYPAAVITRAEIVTLINNFISSFIVKAGTYDKLEKDGNVVVNVPGVTLKNLTVNGNLIVAPGVAEGDFILDNVKVTGDVVVLGGGSNSFKVINGSSVGGSVIVDKVDGQVRIYATDGTDIKVVEIEDGSDDVILEGTFADVIVNTNAAVKLAAGTVIEKMELNAPANIDNSKGHIKQAIFSANASGAVLEVAPDKVSTVGGVSVTVTVGGKTVTASGESMEEIKTGGGGGGGGGDTQTTVSSVTLYLNGTTGGTTVSVTSGSCTFDISSLPDDTVISGVRITTNKASSFVVGEYSINTNTTTPISTFLEMIGIDKNKTVSLGKIRSLGDSFKVSGSIQNGSALEVEFLVGVSGYYTFTNNGTHVTATLKTGNNTVPITSLNIQGSDPVKLLLANIDNKGTDTVYELEAQKSGISFTKTYTGYDSVKNFTLSQLVAGINSKGYSLNTLGDLTGITVTLTYGTKTITLTMK